MGTFEELIEKRPGIKLGLGESVSGTIEATSSQQSIDFDSQQPAFWTDGQPKMLAVFSIRVDGGESGAVYVQWWGSQRLQMERGLAAFKAVSGRIPMPGDRMRVTYVRDETAEDRAERDVKRTPPIPAKLYRYEFIAGVPIAPAGPDPADVPFDYSDNSPF